MERGAALFGKVAFCADRGYDDNKILVYRSQKRNACLSHVKVQITASGKDIYLVLVYGITEHPMMPATNKEIRSKEDVINAAKTYFSQSPAPVGLIKAPLVAELPFQNFQKIG